jgi:hypothetical protein
MINPDYVIEQIEARMDPDEILEVLDLEMPILVEALRDHILDNLDRFIDHLELEIKE